MKVLVIDDDCLLGEMMVTLLEIKGFEVQTVSESAEALSAMRKVRPDAVLLDIMMPGIDGIALCAKIRADETLKETAIVMFTCKDSAETREAAARAGADEFLNKTTPPDKIAKTLSEQIARRNNRQ